MSTAAEIFRNRVTWLQRNQAFWAPEIYQARFDVWVESTATLLEEGEKDE